MSPKEQVQSWADNHFFQWVDKRVPVQTEHLLHRQNLYTFPTRMGFAYLLLAVLIWLLGTNYQNNLILSLSYLQLSVFVVAILHTYFNLAGLNLKYVGCTPVFAGEFMAFKLQIHTSNKSGCDGVQLCWRDGLATKVRLEPGEKSIVHVHLPTQRRGLVQPNRLLVESRFPLGLIRCWSWLQIPAEGIVYPAPIECAWPPTGEQIEGDAEYRVATDGEDFYGFSQYQKGQTLNTVAWKHYARGRGLMSKQYSSPQVEDTWLDWQQFSRGADTELALAQMCYWAQHLSRHHQGFGLRLPGLEMGVGTGAAHEENVLSALALFEVER